MTRYIAGLALVIGTMSMTAAPANAVVTGFRPGWRDAHERGLEIEHWEQRKLERQQERRQQRRREERREARREAAAAAVVVVPEPTPTPVYREVAEYNGGVLTDAQFAELLRAAGFPEFDIPELVYIGHRESGLDPNAVNSSSGACGLLQLYPCYGGSAWLDPATNVHFAYQKYSADVDPGPGYTPAGLSPWAATTP